MVFTTFRLTCFVTLLCASAALGCSRQEEGDRCTIANGSNDCEGDLVCTPASQLRKGDDKVDRCCPEDLETSDNSACAPNTNSGDGDGDGDGEGGGGGTTGGGGEDGGGEPQDPDDLGLACDYPSDCSEPLTCGPRGKCQYECQTDRDCDSGETCSKERICVAD